LSPSYHWYRLVPMYQRPDQQQQHPISSKSISSNSTPSNRSPKTKTTMHHNTSQTRQEIRHHKNQGRRNNIRHSTLIKQEPRHIPATSLRPRLTSTNRYQCTKTHNESTHKASNRGSTAQPAADSKHNDRKTTTKQAGGSARHTKGPTRP
jgi:hypothetical protein